MVRLEQDTLGSIEVPADRLWGAQTQRSLLHFAISTERMPGELVRALAMVKHACASTNQTLGLLSAGKAQAIMRAAAAVARGELADHFPLSVWQTGSGTQTNMNMNEVLANHASALLRAQEGETRSPIHPNDDVNLGQSSNDIFPTAMHVAVARGIVAQLRPALRALIAALVEKSAAFANIVKIGRTHLQDATPLSLGQEFSGYVAQLQHADSVITALFPSLYPLAVGGTAVGTGMNTHPEFGARVAALLADGTGLPFVSAPNKFAALAAHDGLVAVHGGLRTLAVALMKIANDIRWLASGPRSGLGEISLPVNEPGSSMMPGKVNPTQCEALTMICCQVIGNDVAISVGGASGHFELNVFKPLIAHNILQSIRLLSDGMSAFTAYCVTGVRANPARIAALMEASLMLVTALVPHIGYDKAAAIATLAQRDGLSLEAAALSLGYVTPDEYRRWVVPEDMTRPAAVANGQARG